MRACKLLYKLNKPILVTLSPLLGHSAYLFFLGFSATLGMFVGVKKMSTEVWCIRESHVYSMLTKRKTTSLGYAEPKEEKRIRSGNFHQPDTRFWSKERTEKRKPTKRGKDRFACLPSSGSLATHPFFSLSLSLSPSSKLHQKKKAERKKIHRRSDRG